MASVYFADIAAPQLRRPMFSALASFLRFFRTPDNMAEKESVFDSQTSEVQDKITAHLIKWGFRPDQIRSSAYDSIVKHVLDEHIKTQDSSAAEIVKSPATMYL